MKIIQPITKAISGTISQYILTVYNRTESSIDVLYKNDLSDVLFNEYKLSDEAKKKLSKNGFVLSEIPKELMNGK